MKHKHRCSSGHVWAHEPTPSSLGVLEWKRANDEAHTCPTCGEQGVFNRFLDENTLEDQLREASDRGRRNAEQIIDLLSKLSPEMEQPELLATVYYFARTAVEAMADWGAATRKQKRASGEAFNPAVFWDKTFGKSVPNPFTKSGVADGGN